MNFSVIRDNFTYLLWGTWPNGPLGGAALTLVLSIGSALVSALIGGVLGIALSTSRGAFKLVLIGIIGFFRAIPVLMLIFWTYFLLPIVLHINVPGLLSVMTALSLIGGAYLANSVSAGIQAVPRGQWEAGLSIGLNYFKVLRHIVLPQALRMMLPSFINQWVSLIKDTSLAYIVGVGELSFLAAQVNSRTMIYADEIFLFVGLIYFAICSCLDLTAAKVSRKYSRTAH